MKSSILLALALIISLPDTGQAQSFSREGVFVGLGLGAGSLGGANFTGREGGISGFLRAGRSLNDVIMVGGELEAWSKSEEGVSVTNGAMLAVIYVYLDPSLGLYLKSGLGIATIEIDTGILGSTRENGRSFTLGTGYDFGIGDRLALTPYARFQINNFPQNSTNFFALGLGFTLY